MRLTIIFCLLLCFSNSQAQFNDYKLFGAKIPYGLLIQHAENKFWYNPAAISGGEDKIFTFAISPNSTTNGYTSTVTLELPSRDRKNAFALQLNNYRFGIYRQIEMQSHVQFKLDSMIHDTVLIDNINITEAAILYSKNYYFGAENKISIGAQLMFRQFRFIPIEPESSFERPILIGDEIYKPDLNIGVQYSRNKFYGGISLRNIFEPSYQEANEIRRSNGGYDIHYYNAKQYFTAFFTVGNTFKLSERFKLQSHLLVATDDFNMLASNMHLNNSLVYKDNIKIGFTLRDPSIYNTAMWLKYGSRKDIPDKHTFHFTNFALNTGFTIGNTDVGGAFNFQQHTGMELSDETGWKVNAMEFFLKARI